MCCAVLTYVAQPQAGGTGGIGGGHGRPQTSIGSQGDGDEGEWKQRWGQLPQVQPWWVMLAQTVAMPLALIIAMPLAAWIGCGLLKAGMVESSSNIRDGITKGLQDGAERVASSLEDGAKGLIDSLNKAATKRSQGMVMAAAVLGALGVVGVVVGVKGSKR